MIDKLLAEPLLHFLCGALLVLAVFNYVDQGYTEQTITISKSQLIAQWQSAHNRLPTAEELAGLVQEAEFKELYYREALRLGLDQGDAVVRNRMIQKMQFINEQAIEPPNNTQLENWLDENRAKYQPAKKVSFQQIYLGAHLTPAESDDILKQIRAGQTQNRGVLTSVPNEFSELGINAIAKQFGQEFADTLNTLSLGQWHAPIASGFGAHAVRVLDRKDGHAPTLDSESVRQAVSNDWYNAERNRARRTTIKQLRAEYEIEIVD